jgi:hypothetical protein
MLGRPVTRGAGAISVAVASLCLGAAVGGTSAAAATCQQKGSKLVRLTKDVRVYDVVNSDLGTTIRTGCFRANNRRTYLGQTTNDPSPDFNTTHVYSQTPVALRGRFAANATTDCINPLYFRDRHSDCQEYVTVWDLRSGKVVHYHFASFQPGMQNYMTHVEKIVLQATGSVAWATRTTQTDNGEVTARNKEVARIAATGYRLLDSGDAIDVASLVLSGQTLRWTNGEKHLKVTLR